MSIDIGQWDVSGSVNFYFLPELTASCFCNFLCLSPVAAQEGGDDVCSSIHPSSIHLINIYAVPACAGILQGSEDRMVRKTDWAADD